MAGKNHKMIDRKELMKRIGLSYGTIKWLINSEQIPFIRISPKKVMFFEDEIELWLEKMKKNRP